MVHAKGIKIMIRSTRGFSLIEMSVIIVILSLLIGGVVSGRNLIEKSKMQSIIKEFDSLNISINNFVSKYEALPGDMSNADKMLGTSNSCNGDGDNRITSDNPLGLKYENACAWAHLSASGLLSGHFKHDYIGNHVPGATIVTPGLDVPESKFSGGVFFLHNIGFLNHRNFLIFSGAGTDQRKTVPILTSPQAMSITKKTMTLNDPDVLDIMAITNLDLFTYVSQSPPSHCYNGVTGGYLNLNDRETKRCALGKSIISY